MQISCEALSVGHQGVAVQQNLSFVIDAGAYLCIIGENGAGKTTLMKTILGLLPPISGRIIMGAGLRSTDIGYLPQQTQMQKDFPASVFEVVLSGCLCKIGMRPFYRKAEKQLAADMIRRLGIQALSAKSYRNLSGGQQQRVLLARALCAADKILLLDEPTTGLDTAVRDEFYSLVRKLNEEGTTIIMITHSVEQALTDASHVLSLGRGEAAYLSKEAYFEKEGSHGRSPRHT